MTFPLQEVANERARQNIKWGDQDHPDGTGDAPAVAAAVFAKAETNKAAEQGTLDWRLILDEEVAEAFAESDRVKLRTELIQVAAVAIAWVEAIDRRTP